MTKKTLMLWFGLLLFSCSSADAQSDDALYIDAIRAIDQPMLMNVVIQCDADRQKAVQRYKELCDNTIELSPEVLVLAQLPEFKKRISKTSAQTIVDVYAQPAMQSLQRKMALTAKTGEPLQISPEELSAQSLFQETPAWIELEKYIFGGGWSEPFMAELNRLQSKIGYKTNINWQQFKSPQ